MSYTRDADELILFADNEGPLYDRKKGVVLNMISKMKKGKYDPAKGAKLWLYFVETAAREHVRQIGGAPFSRAVKLQAAKEYERRARAQIRAGEWDWVKASRDTSRRHVVRRSRSTRSPARRAPKKITRRRRR